MRRAKLIVLSSLGVVLLTVAAAVIFLATAGDGFYRWALGQAIEGRLDRRVVVDGSFSFEVGLEPTVIVTDVWLENAPWAGRRAGAGPDRTIPRGGGCDPGRSRVAR